MPICTFWCFDPSGVCTICMLHDKIQESCLYHCHVIHFASCPWWHLYNLYRLWWTVTVKLTIVHLCCLYMHCQQSLPLMAAVLGHLHVVNVRLLVLHLFMASCDMQRMLDRDV